MIGDVVFLHDVYVVVNDGGTIEKLPKISWFWQIVLFFKSELSRKKMSVIDVRQFCKKHSRYFV